MINNEFDTEIKYKLFRTVKEILHPTISKKNISDYKIILDENILPVRVFYPKKITDIEKVVIYIHGDGVVSNCMEEYSNICKNFALSANCLVIALEYDEMHDEYKKVINKIMDTIKYLYEKLIINNIKENNITVMGDSTAGHIIGEINKINNDIPIKKELLFYPVFKTKYNKSDLKNEDFNIGLIERINSYFKDLSLEDIKTIDNDNLDKCLIVIGNVDMLNEDVAIVSNESKKVDYVQVPFSSHGFLKNMDKELSIEVFSIVNKFI
ncbi:MAG: alpha/beta hydrolase fold domain-containing protein [Bacilli bacterium]|nr:alpha/beta hydrolase fold domain-containing protein [Bacilli bacterium]